MTATLTPAPSTTPTAGQRFRRSKLWLIIAAAALLFAIGSTAVNLVAQSFNRAEPLDGSSTGPRGAKAVVSVLQDNGVKVIDTNSLSRVKAIDAESTLVVRPSTLAGVDFAKLKHETTAKRVVLISPNSDMLRAFVGNDVQQFSHLEEDTVIADTCEIKGISKAQHVNGLARTYRVGDEKAATECFRAGKGDQRAATIVRITSADREIVVVGGTAPFANETVTENDNAAFALGLFGQHEALAWYTPNAADFRPPHQSPLPTWIPTVWLMGIMTLVTAAIWRGRRLGPLVVERMPIAVPANETVEGRGRLYEASRARQHALDAVREQCIRLVARRAGLGAHPDPKTVTAAVHSATGRSVAEASRVLYEAQPRSDRQLVSLVEQVQAISREIEPGAARTGRDGSPAVKPTMPSGPTNHSAPQKRSEPNDTTDQGQRKDDR